MFERSEYLNAIINCVIQSLVERSSFEEAHTMLAVAYVYIHNAITRIQSL